MILGIMKIKHVFLTGRIQVGKSTLLRSVLSDLRKMQGVNLEYDGFITYFDDRQNDTRNLCMERISSDKTIESVRKIILHFENRIPQMQTLAYETEGVSLLDSLDTEKLLIFDECGKFEKNSVQFLKRIKNILNSDTHVFGVLRKDDSIEWLQEIAGREDVCVIEVTEENRTVLKEDVKNLMLELLGENNYGASIT